MSCLTKMLGIGKSEKARFEVRVTGDDDQVFVTEMSMSALKNPLRDHLLVPFINQVQHAKGTNVECSHIEVNGSPIETMTDLLRPLSEYIVPGGTSKVQLTLELVGGGSAGVRRPTFFGSGSTRVVPSATEAVASIPNSAFALAAAANAAADKAAAKAAADKAAAAKACQEADDAQLDAALAASLVVSGPVPPRPPPSSAAASQSVPPSADAREARGPQPADTWTENVVSEWLRDIGLDVHVSAFADARIDGRLLLKLDDEDLLELGVTSKLQRKLILSRCEALREGKR
eukprot:jgi/Chrpa1/22299/Chrysochromulina_OHIO_Genome00027878-RA